MDDTLRRIRAENGIIRIGKMGEIPPAIVEIPIGKIQWGAGRVEIKFHRAGDTGAYLAEHVEIDGSNALWYLSEADLCRKGAGEAQVVWYAEDGHRLKSDIYRVIVDRALEYDAGEPDVWTGVCDRVAGYAGQAERAAESADTSAKSAQAFAAAATGSAGQASVECARAGQAAQEADQAAVAAAEKARLAEAAAEQAGRAAQAAEQSKAEAENAGTAAENAKTAAQTATEHAETAERSAAASLRRMEEQAGTAAEKLNEAAEAVRKNAEVAEKAAADAGKSAEKAIAAQLSTENAKTDAGESAKGAKDAMAGAEKAAAQANANAEAVAAGQAAQDQKIEALEKAGINDGCISAETPWSSKQIVDFVCPALEESGNPVTCYPVAGYPLGCKVSWEPTQAGEGEPYPAGGGPQLLDISRCTDTVGKPYGLTITIDGDIIKCSGVPSAEVTTKQEYGFAVANSGQEELRGKGYKITAWPIKGKVSNAWGLRTADESSLAIAAELSPGVDTDIQLRLMVSKDTPTAYAPYENIRPISGRNAVSVERCGENLLDILKYAPNGYNLSGKNILKPNTTYTFSPIKSSNIAFAVFLTDSIEPTESKRQMNLTGIYCNEGASVTFTTPNETSEFPYIWIVGAKDGIHLVWPDVKFMLAVATTAPAAYTPYRGDTLDLALPSTIYGGSLDAVMGDGAEGWKLLTMDGSEAWKVSGKFLADKSDWYYISPKIPGAVDEGPLKGNEICSHYPHADVANNNAVQGCAIVWGAIRVRWGDTIPDDADTWKAYLAAQAAAGTPVQVAYKLATPTHIMATGNGSIMPIPGETNTIMTDADRVTVTGRADPIRIIQQLQAQLATATQQLDETQQEVVDTTAMTVDYIYQQDLAEIGLEEVDDSDNQTDTGAADVPGV